MINLRKNTEEKSYSWQGINQQGERIGGNSKAINRQHLQQQLQTQGIYPTKIRNPSFALTLRRPQKVKLKHIADVTQQLALLLTAGIELSTALTLLIAEMQHPQLQQLLTTIHQKIQQGENFSDALRQHKYYFDSVYISLVAAGEASGLLAPLLLQLNSYQQRLLSLRQKIAKAMFYPLIVAGVASLITILLLLFVVPQFQMIFNSMGAKLPLLTRDVISLSHALHQHGLIISIIAFLMGAGTYYSLRRIPYCQHLWQCLLLVTPLIKKFIHLGNLTRVLRIMSTILEAGLPLVSALRLSKPALNVIPYQQSMLQIINALENGQSLQEAMHQNQLFNQRYRQMLSIAENAGELAPMLKILAQQSEYELDQLLDQLSKLLEPCMMLLLAVILGGMIIAMYLPVFKLGTVM